MTTELEIFLGDKENASDLGNLLWCFSEKAKGDQKFLKDIRILYRKLGVKTKPTVFHALVALSKIEGKYSDNKEIYNLLVNLITSEDPSKNNLENRIIKEIRILTCAGTFEKISGAYIDSELNKPELLSDSCRTYIINDRNRATRALVDWLNEAASGTVENLSNVGEVELVSVPQKVEVKKSASTIMDPWEDWFDQLASEGSEIREKARDMIRLVPPDLPFHLVPVNQIVIRYNLPNGAKVEPAEGWKGPIAFHDSNENIFVLRQILEKDYLGKPKELESFDNAVAEQVGSLLFHVGAPDNGYAYQDEPALEVIREVVRETLERPGVILERLRQEKQDHFFHQYQDQVADPDFAKLFEKYQRLNPSAKSQRLELETKMHEIIKDRFVEERRAQIKGYGYDEFSVFAELVQNAEDAYADRAVIGLEDQPQKNVVFRYEAKDDQKRILVVEHCGRPFNYWRHGSEEELNFKRDVEGVLRSAGSFKPHAKSFPDSEKPIGRFGLGFKSVYLITNKPQIHSGQWHFEIDSACVPKEISVPDDFPSGITRIGLPLAEDVMEERDITGERLVDLLPFLRQVQEIELKNSDGSCRIIKAKVVEHLPADEGGIGIEQVELSGVDHVRGGIIKLIRIRHKESAEQLGIYLAPDGMPAPWEDAFNRDTFAVLPLNVHLSCGLGVSHLFELQSGRTHLIDPEGNRPRFEAVANLLRSLPNAIACCLREDNSPHDVLLRFWSILRWNRGDKDAFVMRQAIARVLVEVAQQSEVVPTMNPRKCVSLADQPVFCFKGIPPEFGEELIKEGLEVSVGEQRGRLTWENVVPDLFRRVYEATCRMSGIEPENMPWEIGWAEIGTVLKEKNLFAERPRLLSAMARSLSDEDLDKVKEWLPDCLFKADDDSLYFAKNLLPRRFPGCDHLPQRKMRCLHETYDEDATDLLKRVGLPSRPSVEDIEEWIREGLETNECVDLLKYLEEAGRWRRDFYRLGELFINPWFKVNGVRLTTNDAYKAGLITEDLIDEHPFRVWLGIRFDGEEEPSPERPEEMKDIKRILEKIYDWWEAEKNYYIKEYEHRVYPYGQPPPLKQQFYERDENDRRGWLNLLLLGCSHTMGRTIPRQHRNFLEMCMKRGWFKVFVDPDSPADDWIEILEQYLEEQVEDAPYYNWMKQFVSIYQVARYLSDYIGCLLDINRGLEAGRFNIDEVTKPKASAKQQFGGYEAPSLNRALGIGVCFVLREMTRQRVIHKANVYPYCYVPAERVRNIFIEDLNCRDLISEREANASRVIYEFLRDHLGQERATFNLSFDLPFLTLADNPSLRYQYLRPRFL